MKKILKIIVILVILLIISDILFIIWLLNKEIKVYTKKTIIPIIKETKITSLTINAIGDLTIGSGYNFGEWNSFNSYLKDNDYSYYFKGVYDVLSKDDLTIGNLEGTFTDSNDRAEKMFNFKNTKDYVNVLKSGSVEIVNVANNHTYDYKEKG